MGADPEEWQLGGASPELYERFLVPAVTLPWAKDLVQRVGLRRGHCVLDVACGSGAATRLVAERVGERGRVAGLDVNPGMLAVARSLSLPPGGARIEWYEGSALSLPFPDGAFDVVLCQLGLQFVPDRPAALREMHRVLGCGGCIGASVFTPIDRNPATHALSDALDRHLGAGASRAKRHEHSLGDPDELRALFVDAGFDDVRIETVARTVCFASAAEYVRIQFVATPLADVWVEHESADREQILRDVTADVGASLARFVCADGLAFPQEVHVALAGRR